MDKLRPNALLLIASLAMFLLLVPGAGAQEPPSHLLERISSFIGGREPVVVVGEHASLSERSLLEYYLSSDPSLSSVPVFGEEAFSREDYAGKPLMLIGGPSQNGLSRELYDPLAFYHEENLALGRVVFLDDEDAIIFSDDEGFSALRRRTENSPLSGLVSQELIPAAATGIGFSLILFWKLLAGLSIKVAKFRAVSFVMGRVKKKQIRQEFLGLSPKGVRIKAREWTAILFSAMVFAVSLSYLYLSPGAGALSFFLLTVSVNFMVYTIRHSIRIVLDRVYDHHTEYYIWPVGAAVTALTGWMGNTFGMAGYVSSEKDTEYEGKMAYLINMVTVLFFACFFIWNSFSPNVVAQMAMLLALAIAYIQMLPIKPFSGRSIFAWRRGLWLAGFAPLTVVYIFLNLA